MTHRVKSYTVDYTTPDGKRERRLMDFDEHQALHAGAELHADGIAISAAIRLMNEWNASSRLQRVDRVYSIPFVSQSKTEEQQP